MNDRRPNETLHAYLQRRERELIHQIAAFRGELAPRERELTEVRQAMSAVGLKTGNALTDMLVLSEDGLAKEVTNFVECKRVSNTLIENSVPRAFTFNEAMAAQSETSVETIKQLVLRAFTDHFHDGATPLELRTYINDAYGREIDRTSMGPQLSRMRDEGVLIQPLGTLDEGKWRLKLDDIIQNALDTSAENKPKRVRNSWSKK
jgi:hypothetical protein